MKTRRSYDDRFKEEAVKLANETTASNAARSLGIPETTVRQWITKMKERPDNPFVGSGNKYISPADAEKAALLKENRELKRVNEILKEAMAFFALSRKK
jgi:transposase